jgi:hypothetical protein
VRSLLGHRDDRYVDRWSRREGLGWTEEVRAELATRCRQVLGRPSWRASVSAGYESGDAKQWHHAWVVAPRVGADLCGSSEEDNPFTGCKGFDQGEDDRSATSQSATKHL